MLDARGRVAFAAVAARASGPAGPQENWSKHLVLPLARQAWALAGSFGDQVNCVSSRARAQRLSEQGSARDA